MQKMLHCIHCGREIPTNPRLKGNQNYCNMTACQNARKKKWYQQKIDSDPDYTVRQKECKRNWRKNKPAHAYQKRYRETHQDYVTKNREQQRERNRKRRLLEQQNESQKIVKIDTLSGLPGVPKRYKMRVLTPNVSEKIVKIDALVVELQEYQEVGSSIG
jgi:hypothetical protein